MFQFAFAHAAAQQLGTTFALGPSELPEIFTLGRYGRRAVRAWRFWPRGRNLLYRSESHVHVEGEEEPEEVRATLRDETRYTGFFQSERWFSGYEDEVRELFTIRARHLEDFARVAGDLGTYACAHVRRGDYADFGSGRILPAAYYERCLAELPAVDQLVLVSDDPAGAQAAVPVLSGARAFGASAAVDLALLAHAKAVVTSASSFSWWGAWLNRTPDAVVLAPRHWLGWTEGREWPRAVVPERWTQVTVPEDSSSRLSV
jgi:hypothetical protein